jgi:membrane protein required for colicin V production
MPITLLDIVLIVVMLVSGLLAMVRGFMREVLSITAWVLAAAATLYSYSKLLPFAKQYFNNDLIATAAVVGGVFMLTLLIVSVLTIRISDMVLDSRVGALDRTLGFLFGLGRGLLIVVVAYAFFDWLVPDRSKPDWVMRAKSKVVLSNAGDWLKQQLPENAESTILKKLKPPKPGEDNPEGTPEQRGALDNPADRRAEAGYDPTGRIGMRQPVEVRMSEVAVRVSDAGVFADKAKAH